MTKPYVVVFFLLVFAVPAFGKPDTNVYPVPCSDLWNAVKDTLGNTGSYNVMEKDEDQQTALFVFTGSTRVLVEFVSLNSTENGCELLMKVKSGVQKVEYESTFLKRVGKALDKLKEAKPAKPEKPV
jgi:hypothetical protein